MRPLILALFGAALLMQSSVSAAHAATVSVSVKTPDGRPVRGVLVWIWQITPSFQIIVPEQEKTDATGTAVFHKGWPNNKDWCFKTQVGKQIGNVCSKAPPRLRHYTIVLGTNS